MKSKFRYLLIYLVFVCGLTVLSCSPSIPDKWDDQGAKGKMERRGRDKRGIDKRGIDRRGRERRTGRAGRVRGVTILCQCGHTNKYVSGRGEGRYRAEQQAEKKCRSLSLSIKNCELAAVF